MFHTERRYVSAHEGRKFTNTRTQGASASAVGRETFDGLTKGMPSTYTKKLDTFAGDRQAKTTVIDTSDPECHARGTI